jgi:predicted amidohydrolase
MPGPRLKIAAAQYPIDRYDTLGAYKDKLARWVAEAAGTGAKLLVFPEYGAMEWAGSLGAARAGDLQASLEGVAAAMPEMDAEHADLARVHGVHILAGSGPAKRGDGRFVNAARLFAPSGRVGVQDKMIMTPFERDWGITPGGQLRVFETALGCIGVAVCYDSEFPLLVRAQVEAGARLLLVPACTEFASGYHRVRTAALARALENTCISVLSPLVGNAPWSPAVDYNVGAAGVYAPAERTYSDTGVLTEGVRDEPGWVYADVELAGLDALVASGEMRNCNDWSLQPGAEALATKVEVMSLV